MVSAGSVVLVSSAVIGSRSSGWEEWEGHVVRFRCVGSSWWMLPLEGLAVESVFMVCVVVYPVDRVPEGDVDRSGCLEVVYGLD